MEAPNSLNVSLLRGVLRIDRHVSGAKTGYRDIGEADKFDMPTPDLTELELFTSRDATGAKVKGTITKYVPKLEISGQEINTFNLALQQLGLEQPLVQVGAAVVAFPLTQSLVLGRSYFLGHRKVSAVVIGALLPGTDYVLDAERGMVYFPITSGAAPGSAPTANYTYASVSLNTVAIGAAKAIHCSLFYTGASAEGIIYDAEIWHALIKPSATLSLINPPDATEYARWSIVADVLGDVAGLFGGSASWPFGRLIEVDVVS